MAAVAEFLHRSSFLENVISFLLFCFFLFFYFSLSCVSFFSSPNCIALAKPRFLSLSLFLSLSFSMSLGPLGDPGAGCAAGNQDLRFLNCAERRPALFNLTFKVSINTLLQEWCRNRSNTLLKIQIQANSMLKTHSTSSGLNSVLHSCSPTTCPLPTLLLFHTSQNADWKEKHQTDDALPCTVYTPIM